MQTASVDRDFAAPYCPRRPGEPVAQSVEHLTFNQGVAGSIPAGLTREIKEIVTNNSNKSALFQPWGNIWGNIVGRIRKGL